MSTPRVARGERDLAPRQKLGKYRLEKRIAQGGFATVYRALDSIEGVRVALKIPYAQFVSAETLDAFRREVRLTAQLEHPCILPIKDASFIDGHFVIVTPLGERTLNERLQNRMALPLALLLAEQMLEALAYAHRQRIVHCDIKPENFIIFSGPRVRLTDFGISKVARRTISATGSGTLGYMAPEQAMGKPSFRSDVFSLGLILWRMLSGQLPEWPFEWPPAGYARLRQRVGAEFLRFLQRAISLRPAERFENADAMLRAFTKVKPRALGRLRARRRDERTADWQAIRWKQFRRLHGNDFELGEACPQCRGPVAPPMHWCPWCQRALEKIAHPGRFPRTCPRCRRGLKSDWHYCPWCHGPGFEVTTARTFSDRRYTARCSHAACRKPLMPYMRYCPWCRRKVRRHWSLQSSAERCRSCGWGIARAFWSYCAWCSSRVRRHDPPRPAARRSGD